MDDKNLGIRIREKRRNLDLTQAQLSEDIGISENYLSAIERGQRSLTIKTLVNIARRLDVTVDYLLSNPVPTNDEEIFEEFRQITDKQPIERKKLALKILKSVFAHLEEDEKKI